MKAYSKGITKEEFVKEMKAHQAADHFLKGTYDDGEKGCAVGCALMSVAKLKNIEIYYSDHREFEKHLGIPLWLARLEDRIFEGLPLKRSKSWPVEFSEAINEGADLSKCFRPMLIFIVESAKESARSERSKNVCEGALVELRKDFLDLPKLRAARNAAYDATDAADAASAAAAAAAYFASAYDATDAAAASAADATAAAAAAVAATARPKVYVKFADKLLELLRECK